MPFNEKEVTYMKHIKIKFWTIVGRILYRIGYFKDWKNKRIVTSKKRRSPNTRALSFFAKFAIYIMRNKRKHKPTPTVGLIGLKKLWQESRGCNGCNWNLRSRFSFFSLKLHTTLWKPIYISRRYYYVWKMV